MKCYISYFYQVRFFQPNMIGISTAKWDPKWFQGPYVDKRGVINGLRADPLVLPDGHEIDCCKPCPQSAPNCTFMNIYREYLHSLDFDEIYSRCCSLASRAAAKLGVSDPIVVLLVHEPVSCPCAERPVLREWFEEHGVLLPEWTKDLTK